jgi:hypothetical protein
MSKFSSHHYVTDLETLTEYPLLNPKCRQIPSDYAKDPVCNSIQIPLSDVKPNGSSLNIRDQNQIQIEEGKYVYCLVTNMILIFESFFTESTYIANI